jgi:hypothetical protein
LCGACQETNLKKVRKESPEKQQTTETASTPIRDP